MNLAVRGMKLMQPREGRCDPEAPALSLAVKPGLVIYPKSTIVTTLIKARQCELAWPLHQKLG